MTNTEGEIKTVATHLTKASIPFRRLSRFSNHAEIEE